MNKLAELFFLPINASAHGHEIDFVIIIMHVVMFVLFFGWGSFFLFALFRFRQKKNPKADYVGVKSHLSTTLEVVVALLEFVILLGFSLPFWAKHVNAMPDRKDTVEVRIVAEQFAWNVHYPGEDEVFGRTSPELMDSASNPVGLDNSDEHAKDDITTVNQLYLPIGQPAYIHLTTKDVIHSFGIPVMRVKQDIIPGMSIPTWFTPTKTGAWEIACAQLCGLGHYRMRGFITVQTQEEFKKWLQEEAEKLSSGDEEYDDFWN